METVDDPEVLLCDTSFLGHFLASRRRPTRYAHWPRSTLERISGAQLAITPLVLAEVRYGYVVGGVGVLRVAAIEHHLSTFLLIPLDEPTLDEYVALRVHSKENGRPMGFHDCWIAATARSRDLPLVTCDRGFLDRPGVTAIYLPPHPSSGSTSSTP
jgi:predicted nucleic acid-binding protein